MDNHVFELQVSRCAIILQLFIFLLILGLIYQLFATWVAVISFFINGAELDSFLKTTTITAI